MDAKERYLESSLNAASPEKKLQALLDGAVHFIARARKELAEKHLDECHNNTVRAQNIYLELLVALDPEAGEYVANLQGLYYLVYDILVDANIRKDDERFAEAQTIAEHIRDMWDEVIQAARSEVALIDESPSEIPGAEAAAPAPPAAESPKRLNIVG